MKSIRAFPTSRLVAALLLAVAVVSCGRKIVHRPLQNLLPEVRITAAPIDTHVVCIPDRVRSCYSLFLHWVGYDPDGRVDHYLFAVDPPSDAATDTVWQTTRDNEERLLFGSSQEVPRIGNETPIARDFHVFVIKAVDNRGGVGPSVERAFFSYTEAPDVSITDPVPSDILTPTLTPSIRINWSGVDRDGVFATKPVKYKFLLLNQSSVFPIERAERLPDSLRAFYAPTFAGWDSVGGDTTMVQFTNLSPDQEYIFVVVGFDEAGAYSPIFKLTKNMFHFRVGYAGALGPKITAFNEFFEYTWRGTYCVCPSTEFALEIPAGRALTINWFAIAPVGADVRCYRWAVDIADVGDETPRADDNDLAHWSTCSLQDVSVTLGPYAGSIDPPEEHRLYIEAQDNVGLKSLGIIRYRIVRANLRPGTLLIVKDTRFKPDGTDRTTGRTARPLGPWPTQAELDTFLLARGGYPWRDYPANTLTRPGLFSAYSFDTVGTRIQKKDLTVKLSILSNYESVVWITDSRSANFFKEGSDLIEPQTALRYMTAPNRFNTLGAYVKQGGRVWFVGGGCGFASTIEWDDLTNNQPTIKFSSRSTRRELVPGRLMYDLAHWQTEFRTSTEPAAVRRYAGRFESLPPDSIPPDAPYLGHLSELPSQMEFKTSASDSLPPLRANRGDFYQSVVGLEYLEVENRIIEAGSDSGATQVSTLDTLYRASGGGLPLPFDNPHNVVMTYYHGPSIPQGLVFTGFNIWTFKRTECQALVDFVMRRIWNLGPRGAATRVAYQERQRPRPPGLAPVPRPVGGPGLSAPAGIRGPGRAPIMRRRPVVGPAHRD